MTIENAQTVFFVIMAIAAVVWLVGLAFLLKTRAMGRGQPELEGDGTTDNSGALIVGQVNIPGEPAEMCGRATALLAKPNMLLPWALVVTESGKDRVSFKSVGSTALFAGRGVPQVLGGQMRFSSLTAGQTDVDYAVQIERRSGLLVAGVIIQVIALAALVGVGFLVHTYFVQSQDPNLRWQTFQAGQAVHFLWPVFLFCGLYRRRFSLVRSAFTQFIATLPYQTQSA